jgi:hypothetical protein
VRTAAACALVIVVALAAGCGGDDEEEDAPERQPAASAPATTQSTGEETAPAATQPEDGATAPEPEDDPGDAEAEEPVRSEAVFTGRAGRISPARVNVPPYIAVRVVLRSADGRPYQLRVEGATLTVGPDRPSESVQLDGLQPQARYTATGNGQRLVVSASAEPGP